MLCFFKQVDFNINQLNIKLDACNANLMRISYICAGALYLFVHINLSFSFILSRCLMAVIVMLVLFLLIEPGISQLNGDENINGNAPVRSFCGPNPPIILSSFINNRNSTLTQLRSQLSSTGVFYSRAQSLSDGDSVFGDAQCRQYLSEAQCVACFDSCVSQLVPCITGNGAYAFSDNCFVR